MSKIRITITEVDNGYIVAVDDDYFDPNRPPRTMVVTSNNDLAALLSANLPNKTTNAPGVH